MLKFSEGTVTSVIISRSPADLSTDGAFHPIETDEKHKYKGKSFPFNCFNYDNNISNV